MPWLCGGTLGHEAERHSLSLSIALPYYPTALQPEPERSAERPCTEQLGIISVLPEPGVRPEPEAVLPGFERDGVLR